jgi:mannose-6-phosphate isomerase-like protein (cupin superfamily)
MTATKKGETTMATTKLKARAKQSARRRNTARPPARRKSRPAAKARPTHKFLVKKFQLQDFKGDGLRTYAHYRDLGMKDATRGMVVAHVIRFVEPCDPEVVSKEHLHDTEFQMIYVLNGSITSWFEGEGAHTMKAGDCWLQPQGIRHKVLDYSDDCELLEIVMPADFETVELET